MMWHYERPSATRIILSGSDENNNALYIVLDRIEEEYPIKIESPIQGSPLTYKSWTRRYPATDASFDGKENFWDRLPQSRFEP
jgi:hypothetical protein